MGYELHITRIEFGENWADVKGPAITPEEWLAVVADDPELTISVLNNSNGRSRPYQVDWSGPGKYPCWLDYSENGSVPKFRAMTEKYIWAGDRRPTGITRGNGLSAN